MRDTIISEIRRLSKESGGKTPSRKHFEQETGIKEHEWLGKLWPRWSDAISEAGLRPNTMQQRLPTDLFLDEYADACLHYGKPPTRAELQIYAQSQPKFSGIKTFFRHFGSKDGLIKALKNRAIERGENRLIEILQDYSEVADEQSSADETKLFEGWVYLLQSGEFFKVGRSDNLEKRIKQISVSLPEKVDLIHSIRTDDPPGIEAYWHRRFADVRKNGEWFKLSPAEVKAFKKRKFQ